ncbi:MAG: TldD/PmbA family protein [Phycisphaerae bacterium]
MRIIRSPSRREFIKTTAGGVAAVYIGGCAPGRSRLPETQANAVKQNRWQDFADIALARIKAGGCQYGDIRLLASQTQRVRAQDQRISGVSENTSGGYGIRALYKGAWGFAASPSFHPADVAATADRAVEVARASHLLIREPVRLAPEPVHRDRIATRRNIDPFEVPLDEKTGLLLTVCDILHRRPEIKRSNGYLWTQRDVKLFASTEGSLIDFDLLAVGGGFGATAVKDGDFQSRNFVVPFRRRGHEHVLEYDMASQAERIADQAVEKLAADQPAAGPYDLVLDPAHLALTIHESCGHPSELDRVLGYEANYAGTSFLTTDKLGSFQYGSKHVNLLADNVTEGHMASTGYDDDGVAGQKWHIIKEGILTGYCTNREVAGAIGETRSRGSCRADSWSSVPIVRISNIGLEPGSETLETLIAGVDRGIYIEGRGSFSIDQKRYNFQFGGDAFWEIKNGKRGRMLKNVIYQGITPEFWNSCDGVGQRDTWRTYGFITCGKGQPGQSGWMTHSASPARFRNVNVIDPKGAQET